MLTKTLRRWSGLLALGAATLLAVLDLSTSVLFATGAPASASTLGAWVLLLALRLVVVVMALLGLVALYTSSMELGNVFGLVAFLIVVVGMIVLAGYVWGITQFVPTLEPILPEALRGGNNTGLTIRPGVLITWPALFFLVFGLTALLANYLPRWSEAAIIVAVGFGVASVLQASWLSPRIIVGVGMAWLGYVLMSSPPRSHGR